MIMMGFLGVGGGFGGLKGAESFKDPVHVSLVKSVPTAVEGEDFWVGIRFKIQPNWHLNAPFMGTDSPVNGQNKVQIDDFLRISWAISDGIEIGETLWPLSSSKKYENEVWALAKVVCKKSLPAENLHVKAQVRWVACKDVCRPGEKELFLDLGNPDQTEPLEAFNTWIAKAENHVSFQGFYPWIMPFLFAVLGGVLLNFMPCVFPVLSLKITNLLKPHYACALKHHGWAFTGGVITSFLILASILLILREKGHALGWGFQMQSPVLVFCLVSLFWLMALNMWGVFEIGTIFTRLGLSKGGGLWGTFAHGILTCLVASPCTAPFMGTALGYALTHSWQEGLSIFFGLGLGVSLPFLLICLWPRFHHLLPKPGAWMETLRQSLGFSLAITVLWLLWTLGHEHNGEFILNLVGGLLTLSLGAWIWGKWSTPYRRLNIRILGRLAGGGLIIGSLVLTLGILNNPNFLQKKIKWQPYSPKALENALNEGRPVLLDFTARWCVTCQLNKRIFNDHEIQTTLKKINGVCLQANWTKHDALITDALARYGRHSIPLTVFYGKDQKPVILPTLLTVKGVLKVLNSGID